MNTPTPKFKFIDLFAGIGGIRLPFERRGGKCVLTSEWDKHAQKTYEAFHGDKPKGDIHQIQNEDIPSFDVLLAGFPCQPFSHAGLRQGFSDTRGTLFFEIERILEHKKPKAFLLENVKGLKTHDKGRTLQTIMEHLKQLGYHASYQILNAKDFGLPQNRERIYIVGFLNDQDQRRFSFPQPTGQTTQVGQILEPQPPAKYTISNDLWAGHQRRKKMHLEKGNGFGYSMFNAQSTHTNTISARYYKDGSEILIEQANQNPRKLTPYECARLQGFPDQVVDKAREKGVSDAQLYKQFGNSVAVNVIDAIAKQMLSAMKI